MGWLSEFRAFRPKLGAHRSCFLHRRNKRVRKLSVWIEAKRRDTSTVGKSTQKWLSYKKAIQTQTQLVKDADWRNMHVSKQKCEKPRWKTNSAVLHVQYNQRGWTHQRTWCFYIENQTEPLQGKTNVTPKQMPKTMVSRQFWIFYVQCNLLKRD